MGDTGVFCGIGGCVGDGDAPSCLNHEEGTHVAPADDDDLEGDVLFQEGDLAGAALAYTELVAHYGTEDVPYPPAATKALPAKSWLRLGLSLPDRAGADPTYRYAPADEVACYKNCLSRAKNWQKNLQADAHYHLALALEETKETEQSEAEYRKALRLDPSHASASNNLGLVLQQKSDIAGAERAFRDALAKSPTHANARYNLAMLLWNKRDLPAAVLELREVRFHIRGAARSLSRSVGDEAEAPGCQPRAHRPGRGFPHRPGAWRCIRFRTAALVVPHLHAQQLLHA